MNFQIVCIIYLSALCGPNLYKVRLYGFYDHARHIHTGSFLNAFQSRHDIDLAKVRFLPAKEQIDAEAGEVRRRA